MPYTEIIICKGIRIRQFKSDVDPFSLKWHWDKEDRIIIPIEITDWEFQFDNELPQPLIQNKPIKIKKDTMHRVIGGQTDLKILIVEPDLIRV